MTNKADYSSFTTHKPSNHYTAVLKQQGRVDLDADWNEDHEIASYLRQTEAQDVIGLCGFPKTGGGFNISPLIPHHGRATTDGKIGVDFDLAISPGRGYVDGILCELEATTPLPISAFLPNSGGELRRVQVPTLVADGRELQEGQWV